MSESDRTDRFRTVFEPEEIFVRFVKNANSPIERPPLSEDEATGLVDRSVYDPGVMSEDGATAGGATAGGAAAGGAGHDTPGEAGRAPASSEGDEATQPDPVGLRARKRREAASAKVVVPLTQRRDRSASHAVPEIDAPSPAPLTPAEVERTFDEMKVLLRYGHDDQVRTVLSKLRRAHGSDVALLRRLAAFHAEVGHEDAARDSLIALAKALYAEGDLEEVQRLLEHLVLAEPDDERALQLLSLLDRTSDSLGD